MRAGGRGRARVREGGGQQLLLSRGQLLARVSHEGSHSKVGGQVSTEGGLQPTEEASTSHQAACDGLTRSSGRSRQDGAVSGLTLALSGAIWAHSALGRLRSTGPALGHTAPA